MPGALDCEGCVNGVEVVAFALAATVKVFGTVHLEYGHAGFGEVTSQSDSVGACTPDTDPDQIAVLTEPGPRGSAVSGGGKLRVASQHTATVDRVVDQPNTIGALPVTAARACGHHVAYLPGLSMPRIADLSRASQDRCLRCISIAVAARTMPHALRRVDTGDDTSPSSVCWLDSTTI